MVEVTPAFELLLRRLEDYTPERSATICGVHPSVVVDLARRVAGGRTKLYEGFDTSKHYHGDLMERAMDLLLALTGNWGRKGTGHDTYLTYPFDGSYLQSLKPGPGIEAAEAVVEMLHRHLRSRRGTERCGSLATSSAAGPPRHLGLHGHGRRRGLDHARRSSCGSTTAGYREVFDRAEWGDSPRPFAEYVEESAEGWATMRRPGPEVEPRVLPRGRHQRAAPHPGRRPHAARAPVAEAHDGGGDRAAHELRRLHADIVLPAAQEAERVNLQYPISHSIEVVFSDKAVEPAGEARTDWWIHAALADAIAAAGRAAGSSGTWQSAGAPRGRCASWVLPSTATATSATRRR